MQARADVLVIGGGGAGLAAAITAAELGRRVILLEKAPALGGSTGWSIGSITAAGTPDQRAAGVQDSAAEHFADLPAWAGSLAHREPRMHNVLPNSRAFIHHLSRRARRAGVDIRLDTAARSLLREGERIAGVRTEAGDFLAARGVVLAGGDFSAGREFKLEFASSEYLDIPAVNRYATGDCQRMAREVGGVVVNGDLAFGDPRYRFAPPERSPWWLSLPQGRPFTSLMRWSLRRLPPRVIRPFVRATRSCAKASAWASRSRASPAGLRMRC